MFGAGFSVACDAIARMAGGAVFEADGAPINGEALVFVHRCATAEKQRDEDSARMEGRYKLVNYHMSTVSARPFKGDR